MESNSSKREVGRKPATRSTAQQLDSNSTALSAVTIVYVGGAPYLLQHDAPVASLGPLPMQDGRQYIPATCFGGLVRAETPEAVMRAFRGDDVWTEEFLSLVFYAQNDSDCFEAFLGEMRSQSDALARARTLMVGSDIQGRPMPLRPGPYIFDCATGNLHCAYRLYQDSSDAFVRGALPVGRVAAEKGSSSYQWLEVSDLIPVPSKLYALNNQQDDHGATTKTRKPLAGLRFGVKDSMDVAGLHTGHGSRCYRELYPPRTQTAACVARLLEAGAVMVGKLRCGQWCDGQDPVERIEEPTPINPRGDGFQKPSGSSSGSAAACASYAWLDFTVGTDTGGSIRHPAAVNGVYGIRPSSGRIPSSGLLVGSPLLDTPGVFARSAAMAERVTRVMFSDSSPSPPPPSQASYSLSTGPMNEMSSSSSNKQQHRRHHRRFKLLYAVEPNTTGSTTPKFFSPGGAGPEAHTPAGQIMESFVSRLEAHLGCKRQELNLYDLWAETTTTTTDNPQGEEENEGKHLAAATSTIYPNLVYGHLARTAIAPFLRDYRAAFSAGQIQGGGGGRRPFIEATTRKRLEYGAGVSDAEMADSERRLRLFADWVNSTVLPNRGGHPSSSSSWSAASATTTTTTTDRSSQPQEEEEKEEVQEVQEEEIVVPLLVYPQVWAQPAYRDEPATRARARVGDCEATTLFWTGFSVYSLSYASGCPDIVVPLGEVPFVSRVTGSTPEEEEEKEVEEFGGGGGGSSSSTRLPVAISIMAPRGMDEVLLGLLRELEEEGGILRAVECGSRLFRD